jgi:hypothetical protein
VYRDSFVQEQDDAVWGERMKLNGSLVKVGDIPPEREAKFTREFSAIIEEHEEKLLRRIHKPKREVFSSDEAYEQHLEAYTRAYENCERELSQIRFHLIESRPIDQDDSEELKEMIANKLAVSSMNRAHSSDWWWTPADDSLQNILRELQRTIEGETISKVQTSGSMFHYARLALAELVYLGIVVALFSVARSRFEASVFAALVMIYNSVLYTGSVIYRGAHSIMWRTEKAYGEIGRALRLKIPVSPVKEAEKAIRESSVAFMIHVGSITIASLIALWHLVAAMLP